jgi:predicted nucleic acid-binding protein
VIHLDTSFLVLALARRSAADRKLRGWLRQREPLGISCVAWAEFLCGPLTPADAEVARRVVGEPVAFATAEATLAARLFNSSGRRRGALADCMIAATAIEAGAALATANPRDFARFEPAGLLLAA